MNIRESRYVRVAKLAYALCKQTLPLYAHPKSPHPFTFPQRAACVLLMFYLNLSYRDMEEWLLASDHVCAALELERIPDHTTLERTFKKLQQRNFDELNRTLLDQLQVDETVIAVDSTGYTPSQASAYYQTRN